MSLVVIERAAGVSRWYAVHTNPNQENRADRNLKAWRVETFNPQFQARRLNQFTGKAIHVTQSLFPRYIFARFESDLLHKISYTRGVHSVVSFGGTCIPVDDDVIAILKTRVGNNGLMRIGEKFECGERVVIQEGPLRNLIGIFERELKGSTRVAILLSCVSYQGRVVIDRDRLGKLN